MFIDLKEYNVILYKLVRLFKYDFWFIVFFSKIVGFYSEKFFFFYEYLIIRIFGCILRKCFVILIEKKKYIDF